jgi:hypothetical protein
MPVPLIACIKIEPLANPLQVTWVEENVSILMAKGSAINTVVVCVHAFASVAKIVYVILPGKLLYKPGGVKVEEGFIE